MLISGVGFDFIIKGKILNQKKKNNGVSNKSRELDLSVSL